MWRHQTSKIADTIFNVSSLIVFCTPLLWEKILHWLLNNNSNNNWLFYSILCVCLRVVSFRVKVRITCSSFLSNGIFRSQNRGRHIFLSTRRLVLKKLFFCVGEYAKYGFDQQGWYGMFVVCGIWCLADVSSVSPSSEQKIADTIYTHIFKALLCLSKLSCIIYLHCTTNEVLEDCWRADVTVVTRSSTLCLFFGTEWSGHAVCCRWCTVCGCLFNW